MIDIKKVQQAFFNLVGFQDSNNPEDPRLDYDLTVSNSGLYVNGAHELINSRNMNYLLTNFDTDVSDFLLTEEYSEGDLVLFSGTYYKAKTDVLGEAPIIGTFWNGFAKAEEITFYNQEAYRPFSDTTESPEENPSGYIKTTTNWYAIQTVKDLSYELQGYIDRAGAELLTDFTEDKAVNREVKPLLSSFILFTKAGHSLETPQSRRVGLKVCMKESRGLLFLLKSLRTLFNEIGEFDIQIHTPNSEDPVATVHIDHKKKSSYQITNINEILTFGADSEIGDVQGDGTFYISYLEQNIPANMRAIKRELNFEKINSPKCGSCPSDQSIWANALPYFTVTPFYVSTGNLPADLNSLWNPEDEVYDRSTNYGLNFSNSIVCDETTVILENIDIFAPALQYNTAYKILEAFAFSTRVSGLGDQIKSDLKAKINFDLNHKESPWLQNYNKKRQALRDSFKQLNSPCLPPPNETRIERRIR